MGFYCSVFLKHVQDTATCMPWADSPSTEQINNNPVLNWSTMTDCLSSHMRSTGSCIISARPR